MNFAKYYDSVFLASALLFSALGRGSAQEPGNERPPATEEREVSETLPWEYPKNPGYSEPLTDYNFNGPLGEPEKYHVNLSTLPMPHKIVRGTALIVAHVPENAKIWFDGHLTAGSGVIREFETPVLVETEHYVYSYDVRISWVENGRPVSQTQTLTVAPGKKYSILLTHSRGEILPKEGVIARNLAKLSSEDRALAAKQQFGAVNERMKLGAVGTPVKIMIKGQPVFLSSDAYLTQANRDPDKTLAKAKELQAKSAKENAK
jgi:uncharacterized protein (TIGR03000 family)